MLVGLTDQMKKHPPPHRTPQRLSLVAQTVQILRENIQHGRWQDHLPGERELAAHLQVSRDTLRAALDELTREGCITSMQRQRRRITAPKAGRARTLKKPILGILSPNPFSELAMLTTAVMDQLRAGFTSLGCELVFHASKACFSERPEHALKKLTQAYPAAAWMILGSREPMQRWFLQERLPCLVLGSCGLQNSITSIDADYHAIGRHAGSLLLRKGHRRIALVMTRSRFDGERECEKGLRDVLAGTHDTHLQVLLHDDYPGHVRSVVDGAVKVSSPPTAFVVTDPRAILTVMTHLLHKGMRIPQDMAVIHCGSSPAAAWITPAVSHYAIPHEVFVRHAVNAARSLLENPAAKPKTIRLMPEFVKGESV